MPTPVLKNKSLYEVLFNTIPNHNKLKTFRCLCYPWLKPYFPNKLQDKSKPCIFIGYAYRQNGYKCLDVTTNRIYVSRHVQIVESEFPYSSLKQLSSNLVPSSNIHIGHLVEYINLLRNITSRTPQRDNSSLNKNLQGKICSQEINFDYYTPAPLNNFSGISSLLESSTLSQVVPNIQLPQNKVPILSIRIPTTSHLPTIPPPTEDPLHNTTQIPEPTTNSHHMITRPTDNIFKPNPKYCNLVTSHPIPD